MNSLLVIALLIISQKLWTDYLKALRHSATANSTSCPRVFKSCKSRWLFWDKHAKKASVIQFGLTRGIISERTFIQVPFHTDIFHRCNACLLNDTWADRSHFFAIWDLGRQLSGKVISDYNFRHLQPERSSCLWVPCFVRQSIKWNPGV